MLNLRELGSRSTASELSWASSELYRTMAAWPTPAALLVSLWKGCTESESVAYAATTGAAATALPAGGTTTSALDRLAVVVVVVVAVVSAGADSDAAVVASAAAGVVDELPSTWCG